MKRGFIMANLKKLPICLAASALCAAVLSYAGATAYAAEVVKQGWSVSDEGVITCADENGSLLTGIQEIDGQKYLFSENGTLKTGWRTIDGKRYFFDPDTGKPVYGELKYGERIYYITPEDGKITGFFTDADNISRIFNEFGAAYTGCIVPYEEYLYLADYDGTLVKENTELDGIQYVIDEEGRVCTGWQTLNDELHYYYSDATVPVGITELDGNTYCFSESGIVLTGWQPNGDYQSFFDVENGEMLTGWQSIDDEVFYFNEDGSHLSGLAVIEDVTYIFSDSGSILTGWFDDGKDKYYSDENGIVSTGLLDIGEQRYIFGNDGKMLRGWNTINNVTYYSSEDGSLVTGWHDIASKTYYFNGKGEMATGAVTIDGVTHRFAKNGVYTPVKICLDAGHFAKYNISPVNSQYYESDFTWTFHLMLKEELEKLGAQVITTRTDKNTDLGLNERGEMSKGCDLFLSLHSNAGGSSSLDRPEAWCTVTGVADDVGLQLAKAVSSVMGTYSEGVVMHRVGTYGDWYSVLYSATKVGTPAILLEHSYHTNYRSTVWLMNKDNLRKMAIAEAKIIYDHYVKSPK